MHELPADWGALCTLVFLLGMRHGLDADHLAAIDGLTRASTLAGQRHARRCGALFSLGHGLVVVSIALLAGMLGARWTPPAWFEALGGGLSIGFLLLIGAVNLRALWRTPADQPLALVGVRGRLLQRLAGRAARASGPGAAMGIGALFALSFDTLSQSALFAVMAVRFGGVAHALVLGLLFVLGMLLSDGLHGWWVAHLCGRSDRRAIAASRTMTLVVACISLLVAGLGIARMASGWMDGLLAGRELAIGGCVVVLIAIGYLVACRVGAARSASSVVR